MWVGADEEEVGKNAVYLYISKGASRLLGAISKLLAGRSKLIWWAFIAKLNE
jgi:hypothetical protein